MAYAVRARPVSSPIHPVTSDDQGLLCLEPWEMTHLPPRTLRSDRDFPKIPRELRSFTIKPRLNQNIRTRTLNRTHQTSILNLYRGIWVAESEGFEPPDLLQSTVFKTAAFDRSANSPIQTALKADYI